MINVVIGRFNRWCCVGLVWERDQKGAFVNLLTFTADVGYGKFGASTPTWAFAANRMRRSSGDAVDVEAEIAGLGLDVSWARDLPTATPDEIRDRVAEFTAEQRAAAEQDADAAETDQ